MATGVPITAPGGPRPAALPPSSVDPTAAYSLYIAIRIQQANPSVQPNQLVSTRALPLLEQARTTCVGAMFHAVQAAGLNKETTVTPGFNTSIRAVLPSMEYTTVKLPQPLFTGTGEYDHDVPPARQLMLVRNACAQGTVVEAHLYAGLNHGETVNASLKDSVPFVRKVLAGEPIKPICSPVAE